MVAAVYLAVLALNAFLVESRDGHDAVSMVQNSLVSQSSQPGHFSAGDHVLVSMVGTEMASTDPWAKASVIGRGTERDTYNVHVWSGLPTLRERLNIPVELLKDARLLEAQESQQRFALEQAERQAEAQRLAAEAAQRAAEAQRLAAQRAAALQQERLRQEAARVAEAQRQAAEAARLKAAQDAERKAQAEQQQALEAKRQAEEEAQKRAAEEKAEKEREQEENRLKEKILAKREADQKEERIRQKAMKAKWEAAKQAKLKILKAENATQDVQRMLLRSDHFKAQQKMASAAASFHQKIHDYKVEEFVKPAADAKTGKLTIRVKDILGKEASFTVLRTTPFKVMMRKACERLGLQSQHARFFWKGKIVNPSDSGVSLAMRTDGLFEVRAPKVRH